MRTLALLIVSVLAGPALAQTECVWVEPKEKPNFTVERHSGPEFKMSTDPKWFRCGKKAGAELTATFEVAAGKGEFAVAETEKITSYSARETLPGRKICEAGPGPKRIKFTLKGTGEFAKLDYASEEASYYCPRCQMRSYDNSLVIHTAAGNLTPKGMFTLQGNVDEEWLGCAKAGSTLEARIYVGNSSKEVLEAKEPAFVIKGLEATHRFKKAFDKKPLCKTGATHMGFELFGTGEMSELNGSGRSTMELAGRCN